MSPIDGVWRAIRRYELLPGGTRVAVAVSGGGDSVALLSLLLQLAPRGAFSVAGLIHINHQLRGLESDRDEAFCQALADRLTLRVYIEKIEVRRAAAATHRSIEDAGRRARYAAIERGRQALGADRVAVGHTRDDQAETVLLKLLRGAGPRGLAGIYPRKGPIVRPLLDVGRAQLRAWSADNGITHVEDASNEDVSNPRNLMRHQVLPALERWCGSAVSAALAQTAEISRADEELLDALTPDHFARVVREDAHGLWIDVAETATVPLALRRRLLRDALRRAGVPEPGFLDVEALRSVVEGGVPRVDFAGRVRGDRNGRHVVLSIRAGAERASSPFRYALPVPGRVWIAEAAATVEAATVASGALLQPSTSGEPIALVAESLVAGGLFVRSWCHGDALRPVGLGGTKKLQDLFVDRKVPRAARHRLPLVVDGRDRVVWVPGHALDEVYQPSAAGNGVVILKLIRLWGGPE